MRNRNHHWKRGFNDDRVLFAVTINANEINTRVMYTRNEKFMQMVEQLNVNATNPTHCTT